VIAAFLLLQTKRSKTRSEGALENQLAFNVGN
jgi:hypothetical protein